MEHRLIVVIPAYNEEPMVGSTVAGVKVQLEQPPLAGLSSEVIVVDDGSSDSTFQIARDTGVTILRHEANLGLGAALRTGLKAALRHEATIAITFDADGQHDPRDIPRIISPLLDNTADAVIGSRLLHATRIPLDRRAVLWGANVLTWLLFGVWTTDSQSGLRALSRRALASIHLCTNRMEVSSEIIAEIGRAGLRFVEVPIKPIYTQYSMGKGQTTWDCLGLASRLVIARLCSFPQSQEVGLWDLEG